MSFTVAETPEADTSTRFNYESGIRHGEAEIARINDAIPEEEAEVARFEKQLDELLAKEVLEFAPEDSCSAAF